MKAKSLVIGVFLLLYFNISLLAQMTQIDASDSNIQYIGRFDESNPNSVVFAYPGSSIRAKFEGSQIDAILVEGGSGTSTTTNYFNVIIDGGTPTKLQLSKTQTVYTLASGLSSGTHTVELFKLTETSVGKVTFQGFQVVNGTSILTPDPLPSKKIMFIGNSITCGYGNESSANPPVSGFTSVNENNYKAWGAVTARNIDAQYHCIAYSGRGLYRNNSGSQVGTAPTFFNQTIADDATKVWDHSKYVPDVVVINLGTNDFAAEASSSAYTVTEANFVNTYLDFIDDIRAVYPNASIICAVGVMMSDYYPSGAQHWTRIQSYVQNVVNTANSNGDDKVYYFKMDPQSAPYGEDWHPTSATDQIMATNLTSFINTNITFTTCTGSVNLGSDVQLSSITFPYTLDAHSETNTGVTFKWYKDGLQIPGATSSTYTINNSSGAAGIYKVVRDSAECTLSDQMEISTQLIPIAGVCNWDYDKKAAVVLTFDDWSAGHPAIVVPELKARNLVATFSIVSGFISDWATIKTAALDGNEMANHTMNHTYASSLSLYQSEGVAAQTAIDGQVTNQKVSTYIYPLGSYDNNLISYLKTDGYVGARGVYPSSGNYTYNFAPTIDDYYKILTYSMDNTVTLSAFTSQINNIISGGGLLTYLYHSVSGPTVTDNNYAPVNESDFQAQMDAIVSYQDDIWVTTFSAALKYHREARCATLGEIEADNGSQWVLKLTDTLSNNDIYNQPLFIKLNMNGNDYDEITQNGATVDIIAKEGGYIMFRAIPDAGNIVLKTSSGIALQAVVSNDEITNKATTITFTATATATLPAVISGVKLDLSSIGGSSNVSMNHVSGDTYEFVYTTPAGLSLGEKIITVTATDNNSNIQEKNITITIGSGISVGSFIVSPNTVINNISNTLSFSLSATDDGTVESVELNLSSLGGSSSVLMTEAGSDSYTYSYILSPTSLTGDKTVTATITDNDGNTKQASVTITINPSISYLDIYTDASYMVCGTCFWSSGTLVEQTGGGTIEGSKDFKFDFTASGWWAGLGLSISNWDDSQAKDFSEYDSIQISYKGPITAGTGMMVSFINPGNLKSSSVTLPASTTYTTAKIALSEFSSIDFTQITQISIDIAGTESGTGTLQFDNIRLIKAEEPPAEILPTSVSISPLSQDIKVAEMLQLTATVLPADANDKSVTWTTNNAAVATVSATGLVTGVAIGGPVTITATSVADGTVKGTATINVVSTPVTGITPDQTDVTLTLGDNTTITATVAPTNATNKLVSWSTSNAGVATVLGGVISSVGIGTCTITVASVDNPAITATITVTVVDVAVTSVTVTPATATILIGGTTTLATAVLPANAPQGVTWTTSAPGVATVTGGVVTGVSVGTATITATSTSDGTKLGTATITVNPILVTGITILPATSTINIAGTATLTASVLPANATNKTVTWTSSNPVVATVSTSGVVTGVSIGGTVTITATANDGNGVIGTASVTVAAIPVTSITVLPATVTLNVGDVDALTATVLPANATDNTYTWTSSNTAVVTVDGSGNITAISDGTATITATANDGSGVIGTSNITVNEVFPTSITTSPSIGFVVGDPSQTLTATILPANTTNDAVTWISSDPSVATVDAVTGEVTPVGVGTCTITVGCDAVPAVTATCAVQVDASVTNVTGVTLDQATLLIGVGKTVTLVVTIAPVDATNPAVTWTSSNPAIATVSNGVVTGVAIGGPVTITVTSVDGSFTATCDVTITAIAATGVTLDQSTLSMNLTSAPVQLVKTVAPADATNKTVTWSTSDAAVATVSTSGVVTPVGIGTATITVTTNDGSFTATCDVTVSSISVTGITLDNTTLNLTVGDVPQQLVATIAPIDASDKTLIWTSSDPAVATVSATGVLTPVGVGTATITAAANDGSGISTTATVNVAGVPVTSVSLDNSTLTLTAGGSAGSLIATVLPANATDNTVTWTSSNPAVATVSGGIVTPLTAGSTTITVTTTDGGFTATCAVTVSNLWIDVTGLTVTPTTANITIGNTQQLTAAITPSTASDKTVTWTSSNPAVATVSATGLVTSVSVGGPVTITATSNDNNAITASSTITVVDILTTSITINNTLSVTTGSTVTASASVAPTGASTSVTWTSSNPSVATVNASGVISGVSQGTATITATATDGTGVISNNCIVTVSDAIIPVTEIISDNIELELNNTVDIEYIVYPLNASDKTVTITSLNPAIAEVDNNGLVTGISIGEVIIVITSVSTPNISKEVIIKITPIKVDKTTLEYYLENAYIVYDKVMVTNEIEIGNAPGQVSSITWNNFLQTWADSQEIFYEETASQEDVDNASDELYNALIEMNYTVPYVGIENNKKDDITIFPTQFLNSITIKGKDIEYIQIFDLNGKLIYVYENKNLEIITLNTNSFAYGTYIIVIKQFEKVITQKIIK